MNSKIKKIQLNKSEQYLIIRGEEKSKPVMLFLHGGPGIPELFTMKKEMAYLEEHFIMVYWEQRAAGKSHRVKDLTFDTILSDTLELSRWLTREYSQEKIYLIGHSWGSFLGMFAIDKYPQIYHAYIGIGQVTNQYSAEELSLNWIREEAFHRTDKRAITKLSNLTVPKKDASVKEWSRYLNIHRGYLFKYGGTVLDNKGVMFSWMKKFLKMREYSLLDKLYFIPSAFYSLKQLWHDVVGINLFLEIKKVEVPVYIFQGKNDYQVSYVLAKAFLDQLDAPKKELVTFENSAHSPHIEESEMFNNYITKILL